MKGGRWVAGRTEEEVYKKLGLAYIEPELREDAGEVDAARAGRLPKLVEVGDIRGDLQMHTQESDGKNTIEEMAAAARKLGYEYIAITDHSKAVTVANGMDEKRTRAHTKRIRAADKKMDGFRILAGIEVDILKNGKLDLDDEVLAELDVVVASIHSYMNLEPAEMTERLLAAIENPHVMILAHPTGRLLLRREPYRYDLETVLKACKEHGVAMECNAYPDRLDLRDVDLRAAKEHGVKVVISTDAHSTTNLRYIKYGVRMARRGWLEKGDVLNTLRADKLLVALRPRG
jgi:DNA polymerase (family 10)